MIIKKVIESMKTISHQMKTLINRWEIIKTKPNGNYLKCHNWNLKKKSLKGSTAGLSGRRND